MKINEIINEGIWDKVKSAAGKAATGAKKFGADVASSVADAPGAGYAKGWGRVGNRLAKQAVGKDPSGAWLDKDTTPAGAPSYASYNDDYKPSHNGEVFVVKARGQEYFKSFQDRWYQKTSMNPNDFSITHPLDDYKDYEVLDKLLQQGDYEVVPVKQTPNVATSYMATGNRMPANADTQSAGIVDQNGNPLR